jgi:hypothetical protein
MAKTKKAKATRRRRVGKAIKSYARKKHPQHIGADVGIFTTGMKMAFTRTDTAHADPAQELRYLMNGTQKSVQPLLTSIEANAKNYHMYIPAAAGIAVSAIVPKIPVIGPAANKVIKDLSHGKVAI